MGMHISTYSSKENGERRFTIDEVIKLCDILNCNIKDTKKTILKMIKNKYDKCSNNSS